jgi:hypothetical protein
MPPADLTRFDFHVVRFMNSYDVEIMTDAEIGQYILLLCKSWLLAHDATLPDDIDYLSRIARTPRLSERVLAKFPVVETERGTMRRNPALFEEWERASERSDSARERVARRSDRSPTVVLTAVKPACVLSAYPNQTNPNQIKPSQIDPSQESESAFSSSDHESKSEPASWKNISVRHYRLFSKKPSVQFKDKYFDACNKYGEEVVLSCFDTWAAGSADWIKRENVVHPLFSFFKKLPDEAADAVEILEAVQEDDARLASEKQKAEAQKSQEQKAMAASIERQTKEIIQRRDARPQVSEDPRTPEEFMAGE